LLHATPVLDELDADDVTDCGNADVKFHSSVRKRQLPQRIFESILTMSAVEDVMREKRIYTVIAEPKLSETVALSEFDGSIWVSREMLDETKSVCGDERLRSVTLGKKLVYNK